MAEEIWCPGCESYLEAQKFSESRRGGTGNICIECIKKTTARRTEDKNKQSQYLKKNQLFDYNDKKSYL